MEFTSADNKQVLNAGRNSWAAAFSPYANYRYREVSICSELEVEDFLSPRAAQETESDFYIT